MRPLLLPTVIVLAFSPACVIAQPDFFVAARAGVAEIDHFRNDDRQRAGQLLAGARWGRFGVELGYVRASEFSSRFRSQRITNLVIDYTDNVDGYVVGVNGRTPIGDSRWYAGGRAGVFLWSIDYTSITNRPFPPTDLTIAGTDPYFGAETGYDSTPQLSVGLALDYFRVDAVRDDLRASIDASMRVASVTLEYRF